MGRPDSIAEKLKKNGTCCEACDRSRGCDDRWPASLAGPDAGPKDARDESESWALIQLVSEATVPSMSRDGGWGQEDELPQSAGCLPQPRLGDAREREKIDGSQDPTLKLGAAGVSE